MPSKAPLRKERTPESDELFALVHGLNRSQLTGLVYYLLGAAHPDGTDAQNLAFVKEALPSCGPADMVALPDVPPAYAELLALTGQFYALHSGMKAFPKELMQAAILGFAYKAIFDHPKEGARRLQRSCGWSDEQVEAIEAAWTAMREKTDELSKAFPGPIRFA